MLVYLVVFSVSHWCALGLVVVANYAGSAAVCSYIEESNGC